MILGLRLWEHALPEPFAWVPTASGALLLYWALYVGAAAYGISNDIMDQGTCDFALWLAHLSFNFGLLVTIALALTILLPLSHLLPWSYTAAGVVTVVLLVTSEGRHYLVEGRRKAGYVKGRLRTWIALAILAGLLFVLDIVTAAMIAP